MGHSHNTVHVTKYKNASQTQSIPLLIANHNYVPTDIQNSQLTRAQHTQVPLVDKANKNWIKDPVGPRREKQKAGGFSNEVTLLDPTSQT